MLTSNIALLHVSVACLNHCKDGTAVSSTAICDHLAGRELTSADVSYKQHFYKQHVYSVEGHISQMSANKSQRPS